MKYFKVISIFSMCLLFGCSKNNFDDVINRMQARQHSDVTGRDTLPYRLFIPSGMEKDKVYPMVLVLHGSGGCGNDNRKQIDFGAKAFTNPEVQKINKSFVLSPQCPENSQWVNTRFNATPFDNYHQEDIPESAAMKMIVNIILELQNEFNIDKSRIYVIGSSMGSSGTWDLITRYPYMFAAAVTISGVNDPDKAGRIANMPIWAFHGEKDTVSPIRVTEKMIAALRKHGSQCKFTAYPNRGHDITSIVYSDDQMISWLFNQEK